MLCFKDMSFCSASDCINETCSRRLTDEVHAEARRWWGKEGAPIATTDFSGDCKDYLREKTNDATN
jgi:hypothetical protein